MSWGMSGMCGEIAGPLDEQLAGLRVLGVPRANLTKLSLTADGPSLSIDELSDDEAGQPAPAAGRKRDQLLLRDLAGRQVRGGHGSGRRWSGRSSARSRRRTRWGRDGFCACSRSRRATDRLPTADRDAVKGAFERLVRAIETSGDGARCRCWRTTTACTPWTVTARWTSCRTTSPGQVALAFDAHAYVVSRDATVRRGVGQGRAMGARAASEGLRGGHRHRSCRLGKGDGQLREIMAAADPERDRGPGAGAAPATTRRTALDATRWNLFREARDVVLAMLDATGKPRPATNVN